MKVTLYMKKFDFFRDSQMLYAEIEAEITNKIPLEVDLVGVNHDILESIKECLKGVIELDNILIAGNNIIFSYDLKIDFSGIEI